MAKKMLPLSKVYQLIEPGPVVMISTASKGRAKNKARANIMTMSWHTMIDFVPPIIGLIISNRNYTSEILKTTKECVVNIPTAELLKKVVACGNVSGRDVNKFKEFGLTPARASCVKAPLIDECYANLECKLLDASLSAKYDLFVVEVLKAWIDPSKKNPRTVHHCGKGVFMVSGKKIKLPSKMK